jgi:hypothetical protein
VGRLLEPDERLLRRDELEEILLGELRVGVAVVAA